MHDRNSPGRGVVKWFAKTKGYGFILCAEHSDDVFFHIKDYAGTDLPKPGDHVSFSIGEGRAGRPAARQVQHLSRAETVGRPYYGRVTERTTGGGLGGAATGLLFGAFLGPVGAVLGAVLGGISNTQQITETCLRCSGTGHVTAITPAFIGFQCQTCRSFWKKRNRENLRPQDVKQSSPSRFDDGT